MDVSALSYLVSSCKNDVEYLHDALFQVTLNNYHKHSDKQYACALNKINIDDLMCKLQTLKLKRNMLNELLSNTNNEFVPVMRRSNSTNSIGTIHKSNSYLHNVSSSGSLLFQMDDIL